ncbi:unnamed protein product [Trichogramma brassicae]|uniref:Uncharacterized protein n=1 Tax=Trichogramma brassicae TaxID=86971 RepID=A0A6H5I9T1_9HYME|nr:unnamed protein product [Trichogramma brassicae]
MILPVSELLLHRMSSCSASRHAWRQQQRTRYCFCCSVREMCTGLRVRSLQRKGNGSARRSSRSRSARGRSSTQGTARPAVIFGSKFLVMPQCCGRNIMPEALKKSEKIQENLVSNERAVARAIRRRCIVIISMPSISHICGEQHSQVVKADRMAAPLYKLIIATSWLAIVAAALITHVNVVCRTKHRVAQYTQKSCIPRHNVNNRTSTAPFASFSAKTQRERETSSSSSESSYTQDHRQTAASMPSVVQGSSAARRTPRHFIKSLRGNSFNISFICHPPPYITRARADSFFYRFKNTWIQLKKWPTVPKQGSRSSVLSTIWHV